MPLGALCPLLCPWVLAQRVVKKTEPKCASKDRLGELLYNKKDKKRNSIQFNG